MSTNPTVAPKYDEDVREDPLFAFCEECESVFENEDLLELHCDRTHD